MPLDTSYAAYLLRLRKMQDDSRATWVASVQNIPTGEHRSFPSVEALATFLLAQFADTLPDHNPGRRGRSSSAPNGE